MYYTALLVNVGCHSDAHEQAKWFGDDIALKSGKYDHEMRSLRGAAAALRLVGSGNPPLHRFRVGIEFAISGHRDLDGMVREPCSARKGVGRANSDCLRRSKRQSEASYEQWDGRGWPGDLKGDEIPIASRLAQLSEFVEVAHRVGGVEAAVALAGVVPARSSTPPCAALMCADAELIFDGLDEAPHVGRGDRSRASAWPSMLSDEQFDDALLAIADFVDLKSPYTLGHARAVADLAAEAGAAARTGRRRRRTRCAALGWCTTSDGSASPTRSGTRPGRSATANGSACACTRI